MNTDLGKSLCKKSFRQEKGLKVMTTLKPMTGLSPPTLGLAKTSMLQFQPINAVSTNK